MAFVVAGCPVRDRFLRGPIVSGRFLCCFEIFSSVADCGHDVCIGWMLPRDEVNQTLSRWPTVLGGTATQYVAMPLFAWLLATTFQFERPLFIGMIMVGCVPGAMASNVLTLMARGNTSYSVSLTTTATLLSPLVVPLALRLALGDSVDNATFLKSARELMWMVVVPVLSGYGLSLLLPDYKAIAGIVGSIIANLTILWIIAFVVAANRDRLGDFEPLMVLALLLLNLLGYGAGWLSGTLMRNNDSMTRALTLEVGMQNAGLGTVLVTACFPTNRWSRYRRLSTHLVACLRNDSRAVVESAAGEPDES